MELDDAFGDRQAQPQPITFVRLFVSAPVKAIKDMGNGIRCDALAIVANHDLQSDA